MERTPNNSLAAVIPDAALAFRGYNVTNLGRTPELVETPAYHEILVEELRRFSEIASETIRSPVDLLTAVKERREFGLDRYAQAIALVVATEAAHIRLLREFHGIECRDAKLTYGYSLGEMMAVCLAGAFAIEDLVRVPLELARDCADLGHDAYLAILFSRGESLSEQRVRQLCVKVTNEGEGVVGISSVLSPNSYLIMGRETALARFKAVMEEWMGPTVHLRLNDNRWPPLHTAIVRQRNIPDRAAVALERIECRPFAPRPSVVSLVTGKRNYDEFNAREILRQWVDHPQRLWDAVCETLAADVKAVIHMGPEPNLVPATFARLSENVRQQTVGKSLESYGMRAITRLARRPWLAAMLPARAALLRAPFIKQIVLEDWLLEHAPK